MALIFAKLKWLKRQGLHARNELAFDGLWDEIGRVLETRWQANIFGKKGKLLGQAGGPLHEAG